MNYFPVCAFVDNDNKVYLPEVGKKTKCKVIKSRTTPGGYQTANRPSMLADYDKFTNRLGGKIFYNMHTHHTKHEQGRLEINEMKSNQQLVARRTHGRKVVGSIPTNAVCFTVVR